ncbi:MAG: hypothetical protein Ct9H300mP6_08980 [Gammaproteobacteria bacterium]|nr:MAG: hypothetical protein Ct9H300mP6_08980 [Gammaproteobacteria bacterium]
MAFTSGKPDTQGGEYIAATVTGGASNSKGNVFSRTTLWSKTNVLERH